MRGRPSTCCCPDFEVSQPEHVGDQGAGGGPLLRGLSRLPNFHGPGNAKPRTGDPLQRFVRPADDVKLLA